MNEQTLAEIEARADENVQRCSRCDAPARFNHIGVLGYSRFCAGCVEVRYAVRPRACAELDVLDLVAEVRRQREIIDGRATPPTFAERVAHMESHRDNRWMARSAAGAVVVGDFDDLPMQAALTTLVPVRWWPLDADGRPCAWPTGGA